MLMPSDLIINAPYCGVHRLGFPFDFDNGQYSADVHQQSLWPLDGANCVDDHLIKIKHTGIHVL
jgi:hypothetical protein